jgi:ADP-heptose:LPS heptosyltransferase
VLVISLLRLGDFIQIIPVLNGLKEQLGVRELDVLVHKPVTALKPLLPVVNNWFSLDRDELQAGLGRHEIPLLTSYSVLKEQMESIDRRQYQMVINLTQTVQSGWLAGFLSAEQRVGLSYDRRGQPNFHSPWFRFLNEHLTPGTDEVFHHTDIFYYGCGLKAAKRNWHLRETRQGRSEVSDLGLSNTREIITLQTLTSDAKKNWSEASWLEAIRSLSYLRPNSELVALGSPSEAEKIDALIQKASARNVQIKKAILSLEGAHSLLKKSALLITGDTSIKHLANASHTPVLELCLGSSDHYRTGAYADHCVILKSRLACSPCAHSSACSQASHICSSQMDPQLVAASAHQLLDKNWFALSELAKEYADQTDVIRTRFLANGFWWPMNLLNRSRPESMEQMIERVSWKLQLNFELGRKFLEVGSESLHLVREWRNLEAVGLQTLPVQELKRWESECETIDSRAQQLLTGVMKRSPAVDNIRDFIKQNSPKDADLTWLERWTETPGAGVINIDSLRKMQTQLERYSHRAQLKTKLIRSLIYQTTESK